MQVSGECANAPSPWAGSMLTIAAAAGIVHGLFTLFWAVGGTWLLSTLGDQLVATFADRRWLLLPVAAVKLGFAVLPALLVRRRRLTDRPWRVLCWAGGTVLVLWGGVNTVVGNLVLGGALRLGDGYDRAGMIGHAWLWDPLFLVWGLALAAVLLLTRSRSSTGRRSRSNADAAGAAHSSSAPDQNGPS